MRIAGTLLAQRKRSEAPMRSMAAMILSTFIGLTVSEWFRVERRDRGE
jgi:hypothetical protein